MAKRLLIHLALLLPLCLLAQTWERVRVWSDRGPSPGNVSKIKLIPASQGAALYAWRQSPVGEDPVTWEWMDEVGGRLLLWTDSLQRADSVFLISGQMTYSGTKRSEDNSWWLFSRKDTLCVRSAPGHLGVWQIEALLPTVPGAIMRPDPVPLIRIYRHGRRHNRYRLSEPTGQLVIPANLLNLGIVIAALELANR